MSQDVRTDHITDHAAESLDSVKPTPLEIPMSKWNLPLDSPIDSARGVTRRNLQPFLKPLTISNMVENSTSAQSKTAPLECISQRWGLSPPLSGQAPSSPVSMNSVGDQLKSGGVQGRFKCACGSTFEKKDDFYDHYAHVCVSNFNVCSVCRRGFARRQDLKHHMAVHVAQTVTCNDCGFKFSRQQALNRHKKHCLKI